jgi:serine/threonine protein kinase
MAIVRPPRLNHPNILAVHNIGQDDGSPYIVSELLEGEKLRERLNAGRIPVRKAIEYAIQIAHVAALRDCIDRVAATDFIVLLEGGSGAQLGIRFRR